MGESEIAQLAPLVLGVGLLGDLLGHFEEAQLDGEVEAVVRVGRHLEGLLLEPLRLQELRHPAGRANNI